MTVAVITGGRDRSPTLAELEQLAEVLVECGASVVRHGDCRGTDKAVAAWVRARGLAEVERWPAEDFGSWPSCGPRRNRAMLEGGEADLFGTPARPRAELLVAFAGGDGTANCRRAAVELGVEVIPIEPALEPRPWNVHHGDPPGPHLYVGRSPKHGGPSPLANPYRVELLPGETRAAAAPRILGLYKRWLWSKIRPGPKRDHAVVEALEKLTPEHYVCCTCWPAHCHAEVVIRAWRWLKDQRAAGSPL